MGIRQPSRIRRLALPSDAFPIDGATWQRLVGVLALPPQQVRIAEQLLRGRGDKEILTILGIRRSTLRTHLLRLKDRVGGGDRLEVACRLCMAAERLRQGAGDSSLWMTA